MRIFKTVIAVVFLALVPPAMWYNLNYNKYGAIDRDIEPVFIQVCTVNAQQYNNTLRQKSAEYANSNRSVKVFVLPLSQEQIAAYEYDIKIINDSETLHAFISPSQSSTAIRHCKNFLNKVKTETEYNLIWKKS